MDPSGSVDLEYQITQLDVLNKDGRRVQVIKCPTKGGWDINYEDKMFLGHNVSIKGRFPL